MKKVIIGLVIIVVLAIAAVVIINLTATKQRLASYLFNYLKNEYGLRLEAEDFDYRFTGDLLIVRMKNVRMYGGENNRELFFQSRSLEAEIPYSSLRAENVVIRRVDLDTAQINANHTPRLKRREPSGESKRTFEIQDLNLGNSRVLVADLTFEEIDLKARVQDNNVLVRSYRARFDTIRAKGSGQVRNFTRPEYEMSYEANGDFSSARKLASAIPPLKGPFVTGGTVSGKLGNFVVKGDAQSKNLSVHGEAPFPMQATYRYDSTDDAHALSYRVKWSSAPASLARRFEPEIPEIASWTSGTFEFDGGTDFWQGKGSFDVTLDERKARGIPLRGRVIGKLQQGAILLSRSNAAIGSTQASFDGSLSRAGMNLQVNARIPNPGSLAFFAPELRKVPGSYVVQSRIQGPFRNLLVQFHLRGTAPEIQLVSSGSYRVASKQIKASFEGQADAKAFARFHKADFQGSFAFQGNASGSVKSPALDATVQGTGLSVNGTQIGEATIQAQSDGRLLTAEAQIPAYSTTATGTYDFRTRNFQVQTYAEQIDMATLRPFLPEKAQQVEGSFTVDLTANGNANRWRDSEAHVILQDADFQIGEHAISVENAEADLRNRIATVDIDLKGPMTTASVNGTVPVFGSGTMDLNVHADSLLEILALFKPDIKAEGPLTVDVHLGGTFQKPDYSGTAQAPNFSVNLQEPPVQVAQGNVVATFSGADVSVRGSANVNGAPLTVNGTVPMTNRAGYIHLTLDRFSIASITTEADVKGSISVDMDAHGIGRDIETWSGSFQIIPHQLVVSGRSLEAPEPLLVEMTSGRMLFNRVRLKSGEFLDAEAQGQYVFRTGEISATIRNTMDLSIISGFMSQTAAEGRMIADIKVGGTLKDPDLQGLVQIENGMFRRFQSPLLLEQIQLRAPIQKDAIRIETFTARMGGGTVEGSGQVQLENWKPGTVDLKLAARRVGMNYPEGLRSQFHADVTVVNQGPDFLVGGKIQVLRSTYREDIDPRDRLVNSLLSERAALTTPSTAQGRIRLNLAVETVEDFQLRNNLGRVQASANLQVRGLLAAPRLFGRVRIRERSEIYFEGNRFEVQRGIVDFYGQRRLNPVLDVELFTIATDTETRQDYEITIPLSGELRDLDRRDPISYPPLAANQVYFLLITGRADAQLGTAGSRFFTQQLASFAAGQVFSDLTRNLAQGFGLDRVEIQPEMIASETNPGAKLVLGKDFSSALSLIYSVSLTDSQEQTWIAHYRAPKNLSFRFVDQEDSYTANVRHLVRFGEGVSTGTLRDPHRVRKVEVETVTIVNDSLLTESEIHGVLGLEPGDTYDFWKVQDKLDELEEKLQDRDVLFSSTQLEETQLGNKRVSLKITVTGKERRRMVFSGWSVPEGELSDYRRFWREGFSPTGVIEIIRENLLRKLWLDGYHRAEVQRQTSTQNGFIEHKFIVQTGIQYPETEIRFLDAEQYPADELEEDLRALYGTREEMNSDAIHDFRAIERKIVALYVRRGFLESSAESGSLQLNQAGVAIKEITVIEGQISKVAEIRVSNNQELPEDLRKRLRLKVGMVHDPAALIEDEVLIGDYYERLGYRQVQVESGIEKEKSGLIVHYDLKKGHIGVVDSIEIRGAKFTKHSLIRKRLQLVEGEVLNQDKLANAQKNLTDLRIFHQVTLRDEPTDDPNRYRVVADVIERNHYEMTYGFRYDTETDLGGEIQLTDINLFGTGQSISLYTRIHQQDQLYRLLYHSPTLAGLRWKTLISTSYERGNLLLLEREKFDGERFDITIQRQFTLPKDFLLIPGYEFEYLTVTPLESPNIEPVEGLKISRFIGTLYRDSRDDPFNSKRGTFFSVDLQAAPGWIGDVSYLKSYNQYLRFRPFGKYLWASAYRLGLATNLPPRVVTERFFAGGNYSIRGLKKDEAGPEAPDGTPLGGEALFVMNQELRFPVWKWFGGAVFYDVGNVYAGVGDFNPFDARHAIGVGLRLNSPFGIARFDYGINLNPEDDEPRGVFHFALGQAF